MANRFSIILIVNSNNFLTIRLSFNNFGTSQICVTFFKTPSKELTVPALLFKEPFQNCDWLED